MVGFCGFAHMVLVGLLPFPGELPHKSFHTSLSQSRGGNKQKQVNRNRLKIKICKNEKDPLDWQSQLANLRFLANHDHNKIFYFQNKLTKRLQEVEALTVTGGVRLRMISELSCNLEYTSLI